MHSLSSSDAHGLEDLLALPVVAGDEHAAAAEGHARSTARAHEPVLDSERTYRYCKAVLDHPLQPSSRYAALAGLSPKTVKPILQRLVNAGLIQEHRLDAQSRGRTAVLLEASPQAAAAVREYEARKGLGS